MLSKPRGGARSRTASKPIVRGAAKPREIQDSQGFRSRIQRKFHARLPPWSSPSLLSTKSFLSPSPSADAHRSVKTRACSSMFPCLPRRIRLLPFCLPSKRLPLIPAYIPLPRSMNAAWLRSLMRLAFCLPTAVFFRLFAPPAGRFFPPKPTHPPFLLTFPLLVCPYSLSSPIFAGPTPALT